MNITNIMKVKAIEDASIALYKDRVEAVMKEANDAVEHFVINLPKNKASIAFSKRILAEYYPLLQLASQMSFSYLAIAGKEEKEKSFDFYSNFPVKFQYGKRDCEYIRPFSKSSWSSSIFNFSRTYFLADLERPSLEQSKVFIDIAQRRSALSEEILCFMKETFDALSPIKTFKQLQENIPAFTRFFPEPMKKNALVNITLNKKVTALLEKVV